MRFPVVMILTTLLFSIIIDVLIWLDARKGKVSRTTLWLLGTSDAVCYVFLAVLLLLPRRDPESTLTFIQWGLYSYLSVYVVKICYVAFSLLGRIPELFGRHRFPMGKWIGLPIGGLIFVAMWWGALVTRRNIEVHTVVMESGKVPPAFNDYKIVQFSDAHLDIWGQDTTFASKLVDRINALHPDIILFTGDIVSRKTKELLPFVSVMSRLKAPYGVYGVLGNHDYGDYVDWPSQRDKERNMKMMYDAYRQMGWTLLDNSHTVISKGDDHIVLMGVGNWGEPPFTTYGNLRLAAADMSKGDSLLIDSNFKILMSHNPEHWNREVSRISNIDLTLSGHTHAMQIMFKLGDYKWSPSKYIYPQWAGIYKRDNHMGEPTMLYVNIGCGEVAIPSRIGATPEITEIILKRKPL